MYIMLTKTRTKRRGVFAAMADAWQTHLNFRADGPGTSWTPQFSSSRQFPASVNPVSGNLQPVLTHAWACPNQIDLDLAERIRTQLTQSPAAVDQL